MASSIILTDRDLQVLRTLARNVRVLTVRQVARTWWGTCRAAEKKAAERLLELAREDLLELASIIARPELQLQAPLATWQPGLDPPEFAALSHRARTRWRQPAHKFRAVWATVATGRQFGGRGGRPPRTSELTHDVHVATVFLEMRATLPTRSDSWVHEDLSAEHAQPSHKVPDAMVIDGRARTAIEFVGEYPPGKLRGFHHYCAGRNWGYELW